VQCPFYHAFVTVYNLLRSFRVYSITVSAGTDLMRRRSSVCVTLEEKLFCLAIMGDERAVMET
jgi:hypothetical protein